MLMVIEKDVLYEIDNDEIIKILNTKIVTLITY